VTDVSALSKDERQDFRTLAQALDGRRSCRAPLALQWDGARAADRRRQDGREGGAAAIAVSGAIGVELVGFAVATVADGCIVLRG
jgi:hypothetical protein